MGVAWSIWPRCSLRLRLRLRLRLHLRLRLCRTHSQSSVPHHLPDPWVLPSEAVGSAPTPKPARRGQHDYHFPSSKSPRQRGQFDVDFDHPRLCLCLCLWPCWMWRSLFWPSFPFPFPFQTRVDWRLPLGKRTVPLEEEPGGKLERAWQFPLEWLEPDRLETPSIVILRYFVSP